MECVVEEIFDESYDEEISSCSRNSSEMSEIGYQNENSGLEENKIERGDDRPKSAAAEELFC